MSDLRLALRQLLKSPGFAFVAIATLALGIGACTAMFSIVNAVLLKPLPFREPGRLVWIENVFGGGLSGRTTRVDVFNGWREQNKSFEALAAYFAFSDYGRQTLTGSGTPERLRGVGISGNFLPTLGVGLLHGRNFTAEECAWQGSGGLAPKTGAVILSHSFWQRRFAGDPAVIGTTVTLNSHPTTIVGVLPRTFDFRRDLHAGQRSGGRHALSAHAGNRPLGQHHLRHRPVATKRHPAAGPGGTHGHQRSTP